MGELLADLMGRDASLALLAERIAERASGNPFFAEELVQSLAEVGGLEGSRGAYRLSQAVEELELPATVQAVLSARIDRLAEREKQLLQTASVIGKELSEAVLRRVAELPEVDLQAALASLTEAEFLYPKALFPEAEYAFRHPLTQEVAYRSQLGERRQRVAPTSTPPWSHTTGRALARPSRRRAGTSVRPSGRGSGTWRRRSATGEAVAS
jgi:adenylate cyclase